jgi:hypothetical protein
VTCAYFNGIESSPAARGCTQPDLASSAEWQGTAGRTSRACAPTVAREAGRTRKRIPHHPPNLENPGGRYRERSQGWYWLAPRGGAVASDTQRFVRKRFVVSQMYPNSVQFSVQHLAARWQDGEPFAVGPGESLATAAASSASGSPWSIPSPSLPWSALRVPAVFVGAMPAAIGITPIASAFAFPGSLVQTLVQTGAGLGASPLPSPVATVGLLDGIQKVRGSSPLSSTH